MPKKLPPLHPGEVLREEFLVPLGLSPGSLAKAMGVPRTRVERIAAAQNELTFFFCYPRPHRLPGQARQRRAEAEQATPPFVRRAA